MRRETGSPKILVSGNWLFQSSMSWCWPKGTWTLGSRLTNPRSGQYLTHAHSPITRVVAAMNGCFRLVRPHQHQHGLQALCTLPFTRPKQLSMAATAWVIWLCARVRDWPDRGLVFEFVTCFYCCLNDSVSTEVKWCRILILYSK